MKMNLLTCRVCLTIATKKKVDIRTEIPAEFSTPSSPVTFLEMFNFCTNLNALPNDSLPKSLCQDCFEDLKTAFDFIKKSQSADYLLRNDLNACIKLEPSDADKEEIEIADPLDNVEFIETCENSTDEKFLVEDVKHIDESDREYDKEIEQNEKEESCSESDDDDISEEADEDDAEEQREKTGRKSKFKCKICSKQLSRESNYRDHMNQHTGELLYKCEECDKLFPIKSSRDRHFRNAHTTQKNKKNKNTALIKPREDSKDRTNCHICGLDLNRFSLQRHINRKHSENPKRFLCSSCPKSFAALHELKNHLRIHDENRQPMYECDVCKKNFYSRSALKTHMKIHLGLKSFHCDICTKSFQTKRTLETHRFTHDRAGGVACKVCDKKFFHQRDVDLHMRFHTGDYPFQCKICEKRFPLKSHYNYHMREHEGYLYECKDCNKKFRRPQNLRKHKFIHIAATDNPCPLCEKKFPIQSKLALHMRRVHHEDLIDFMEKTPLRISLREDKVYKEGN